MWLKNWGCHALGKFKIKMGVAGSFFEPQPPKFAKVHIFQRCTYGINMILISLLVSDFQIFAKAIQSRYRAVLALFYMGFWSSKKGPHGSLRYFRKIGARVKKIFSGIAISISKPSKNFLPKLLFCAVRTRCREVGEHTDWNDQIFFSGITLTNAMVRRVSNEAKNLKENESGGILC